MRHITCFSQATTSNTMAALIRFGFVFFSCIRSQGIIGLAEDLHKKKQVLILQNLDLNLHHFISLNHVMFCSREDTLRELLTQEGIRNGSINLMQHIRASIDLGYKVDPLIHINNEKRLEM